MASDVSNWLAVALKCRKKQWSIVLRKADGEAVGKFYVNRRYQDTAGAYLTYAGSIDSDATSHWYDCGHYSGESLSIFRDAYKNRKEWTVIQ